MAKSTSSLAPSSVCSVSSSSSASSTCSSTGSPASTTSSSNVLSAKLASKTDKTLKKSSSSSMDRRKRLAANARERKRMHLLNKAYDELRRRLVDANNKSKYEVLVQAKEYIQALATICEKFDRDQQEIALRQNNNQLFSKCPDKSVVQDLGIQNSPMDMRASYNSSTSATTTTINETHLNSHSPIQQQHFPLLAHSTLISRHLNYIQRHI